MAATFLSFILSSMIAISILRWRSQADQQAQAATIIGQQQVSAAVTG